MSKPYVVLALDQAASVSGWSVWSGTELLAYGKFDSGGELDLFAQHLSSLLAEYKPDKVVYEGIYANQNVATFKRLAQVQGVLLSLAPEAEEVFPTQWKSSQQVGGKNRAEQKRAAQRIVQERYGVKATQDESDAILIGAHATRKELNWK